MEWQEFIKVWVGLSRAAVRGGQRVERRMGSIGKAEFAIVWNQLVGDHAKARVRQSPELG